MARGLLLLLTLMLAFAASAEIYKWTDAAGKVHFSDQKPQDAKTESVRLKINSYTHVTYELSAPAATAVAPAAGNVVMYSTTWCGYCKKARAYFAANNIPYTDYDIEHSAAARRQYDAFGGRGVPVIFVGQARMNGFSSQVFEKLYERR